ncbi:M23 family metallopeptidase [Cylindrospermum sp. FACHB-282]|uniref:M23 family metallopeptidase n=1 Tax=Cylindrospermum sp. FACHB-282 TaxID=2692794 RepID=UPI0016843FC5|nr:M23 family metallopeptidase [Cylindrospermum sp. FACHB-282]MBD2386525.1 M23 family metallopeptidase [Cylindrospermum sp. FACHB-282]
MTNETQVIEPKNKLQGFAVKYLTVNHRATNILMGIFAALPLSFALPVDALQVQVTPTTPRLGDTLSVEINLDTPGNDRPPAVSIGEKTYPAFEVSPNQYRALVPTTPLEKAGTRKIKVFGDGQEQNLSVQVRDRKFPIQRINLPPGKAGLEATELELKRVAAFKALQTPQKYWKGLFLKPNAARMSTNYGVRRYYNGKFANDYYHRGVDYAGAAGSAVVAPAAGRVAMVGRVSQGFRVHGNVVGIDHGQGVTSIFMHLSRINVKEGDLVKAGQVIGAVGSTGASTGPHLHWGLYVNGLSVDPIPWQNKIVD